MQVVVQAVADRGRTPVSLRASRPRLQKHDWLFTVTGSPRIGLNDSLAGGFVRLSGVVRLRWGSLQWAKR